MKNSFLRRILVFITVSSIIAQSFSPYVAILSQRAYAQEVTDQTTTPETQATTVEQSTLTPESTTPTPSEEQAVVTETVTPTPTESTTEVTPTPTESTTEVTPTEVNNNSPPSENQGIDSSITPTETPVTLTPAQETITSTENPSNEELNLIILDNVSAPSIDLEAVESEGSAILTTDKPDYAPTDTALITGSNLIPNTTYTLKVWSDDEPPTGVTAQIESDENGVFAYAYQLDGTYRPNYSAELKDLSGNIVAKTTFTDSPASGCQDDSGGANDDTGQKDLTKMCADYTTLPTSFNIKWHWDDVSWSGANTGDACALFDTDSDGNVNYALCVGVNGNPAVKAYTKLYSCNDTDFNNCKQSNLISSSPGSTCTTSLQNTDPFSAGSAFPQDTESACNVLTSEVGGSTATLIDVCSYPSGSPSSSASDCIVFKNNSAKLTVTKVVSPSNDSGLFNLQIDGTIQAPNVGNGGTTLTQSITEDSSHTIGETAGTNTSLSNYTSSVVCKDAHGTGNTISTTGTNPWSLSAESIAQNADILCTITNTKINNGSITILKDAQPNDAQDFSFTTTGTGLSSFSLDDDSDVTLSNTKIFNNLASGTYSVSETATTGWTQSSATCTDGSLVSAINLSAGENVSCTFINTKDNGSVKVNKLVDTNGDGSYDGNNTTATNLGFTWSLDGSGTNSFGSTLSSVNTGSHNVNENLNSQPYHFVGWFPTGSTQYSCTNPQGTTLPINVSVTNNTLTEITLCNAVDKGHLIVQKTTVPGADQTVFTINATGSGTITSGGTGTVTDSLDKDYEVTPGTYSVSETVPAGWSKTGDTCQNVDVAAGQTVYCLLTNTKLGSITVVKNTNFGDGTFPFSTTGGLDPVTFNIVTSGNTGSKLYSDVLPGSYSVTENTPANWIQGTISCFDGTDSIGTINGSTASFDLTAGHNVTCTFNNTGQGQLNIVKNTVGGNDTFGFTVSGPTPLTPNILTSGGTGNTGFSTVTAGNYSVSETTIPSDWTLTGTSCTNGQASLNPTNFAINSGDSVTCTFENTRDTGTIELKKHWVGTEGTVTLNIGTTNQGNEIDTELINGADGSTGQNSVITGTYFMSESSLSNYTTDPLSCYNDANNNGRNDNESSVTVGSNDSVNVAKNQHVICTYTNTRNQGTIELKKVWSGTAGRTTLNIGTTSNGTDIANTQTGTNGGAPLTTGTKTVDTGIYYVSETDGLTNYSSSLSCTDNEDPVTPGNNNSLTVDKDHEVICTYTNTRDTGTLRVLKNVDINGDGDYADSNETGATNWKWQANGGPDNTTGDLAITVDTGDYTLTETPQTDYHFVSLGCTGGTLNSQTNTVTVTKNADVVCTFTNARDTGSVKVNKLADTNGDGSFETLNPNTFTWSLEGNGTYTMGDTLNNVTTGSHDVNESTSSYEFIGWYYGSPRGENEFSCQEPDETSLPANINVSYNETTEITLCNKLSLPSLTITKENDAVGNKSPNDSVRFTITITAEETGGPADNVRVIDLLPKGFIFNSSSWKVISSDISRGVNGVITSSLSTPTYSSPGTWNLGHLNSGETLTLTYTATIDGSQATGTYYDNAWGQGNPVGGTDIIFARAINPGDLDAADPSEFVGTQVTIVNSNQPGVDYKAASTQEVLGASTYLPATGENTLWVIIATLLSILGFGSITLGFRLRKKYE